MWCLDKSLSLYVLLGPMLQPFTLTVTTPQLNTLGAVEIGNCPNETCSLLFEWKVLLLYLNAK